MKNIRDHLGVMLDLETIGTGANAAVLSVSAVIFSLSSGQRFSEFEEFVDLEGQMAKGATIDSSTFLWWLAQEKQAQALVLSGQERTLPPSIVATMFCQWLKVNLSKKEMTSISLWGNGITADNTWLRNMFAREEVPFPLSFRQDTDMRTLISLAEAEKIKANASFSGVKHNGLDDCKHQVKVCNLAWSKLNRSAETSSDNEGPMLTQEDIDRLLANDPPIDEEE